MRRHWRRKLGIIAAGMIVVMLCRNVVFIGDITLSIKEISPVRLPGYPVLSTCVPGNYSRLAHTHNTTSADVGNQQTTKDSVADGYELARRLRSRCNVITYRDEVKVFGVFEHGNVQTCIIWKIGTTFIKRLYMIKDLPQYRDLINPYDIPFDKRYVPKIKTVTSDPEKVRFMFVRHPYNRLLSGFVDKLFAPNPIYWKLIGKPAITVIRKQPSALSLKCAHDVTFKEYVSYVVKNLDPDERRSNRDPHFDRMTTLCRPCGVNYDFVGKVETFSKDSIELVSRLGFSNETIRLLRTNGGDYASLDAIKDTVHQPFDSLFKRQYLECISFKNALERSWNKLKIRGLIGNASFPIKDNELSSITEEKFLKLALKARSESTAEERMKLKDHYFSQMFATISEHDIAKIHEFYKGDFELFGYSKMSPNK